MTQNQIVAKDLRAGKKLTALTAYKRHGILRLAARVADLREEGMHIVSKMVHKGNKRFSEYSL